MIIKGHHRSLALAEKRKKALSRKHPNSTVEIISRRNSKGRHAKNGQYFYFEVTEHKEREEYVIHFDYGSNKDSRNVLRIQVHITGPGGSDDEAIKIISDHFENGEKLPKGWRKKTIYWGHVSEGSDDEVDREIDPSIKAIAGAIVTQNNGTVVRRKQIKTNRRKGKRKAKR